MRKYDTGIAEGGYRYIPAVFQYSGGVATESGYRIERVRLFRPIPITEGFDAIDRQLKQAGRPLSAFCACELRSPAPLTETAFDDFNRAYAARLDSWGLMKGDVNPVARTNVCPEIGGPSEVMLYAFSYTVPDAGAARPSFIIAGSGEAPEGQLNYRDHAIRLNDRSTEGLRLKADWVLGEMEARLRSLNVGWADSTATHVYTVYGIDASLAEILAARGASQNGLSWHFSRPPVIGLDYEMDVRGVFHEVMV